MLQRGLDSSRITRLEALRGAAATYVLLHHIPFGHYLSSGYRYLTLPIAFGQEVVILFFLVSGFVIYTSLSRSRDTCFRDYFIKRFRRIYPIFLFALALSYMAACWQEWGWAAPRWRDLAGNFLMLQDFKFVKRGAWFTQYWGNVPLWSLSYEWWFYMLFFPLHRWVLPKRQDIAAFLISLTGVVGYAVHPNGPSLFLAYFSIWWAGVELAREYAATGRVTVRGQARSLVLLSLLLAGWAVVFFGLRGDRFVSPGQTPFLQLRHYAASVLFILGGIFWRNQLRFRLFSISVGLFTFVAPISYALYALHWPILRVSGLFSSVLPESLRMPLLVGLVLLLAYVMEVRVQARINALTAPLLGRGSARPSARQSGDGRPWIGQNAAHEDPDALVRT